MHDARLRGRMSPPALFPFEARYVRVGHHRIHYVEEGEGDPVLFLHGNPTSSYVFRNVLGPVARQAGRRAIAMDLLGFGRSDKPDLRYSCRLHAEIIAGFIDALGLERIALVGEDWGGFLGAHVMTTSPVAERAQIEARIARLARLGGAKEEGP